MKKDLIINGQETNYEIYDDGRCFNKKTQKFLKGSIKNTGYKMVLLTIDGKKKDYSLHRLVAENFLPNPENKPYVNHIDGNKTNNCIENLEWITPRDNIKHVVDTGLLPKRGKSSKFEQNLNNEKWVQYLNTQYSVSNLGRIRNDKTQNVLQGSKVSGYWRVCLRINNCNKTLLVHQLVYFSFHPDVKEKKNYVINHIDGNVDNNSLDNLEYIKASENILHGKYQIKNKSTRTCIQYDLNGNKIKEFDSLSLAAEAVNGVPSGISLACNGKIQTYKHFIWKFK